MSTGADGFLTPERRKQIVGTYDNLAGECVDITAQVARRRSVTTTFRFGEMGLSIYKGELNPWECVIESFLYELSVEFRYGDEIGTGI